MKVLKFTLSGETAFFKKPDVNSYCYFTYGNIHKVALLGMFGAILGYSGYNQMKKNDVYPEFYERLKSIRVSVSPNNEKGYTSKKVQIFNNSVGYASKEMGGNLIVKEQWLENPSWDIYIVIENEEGEKIADSLINNKVVYTPYLGKNDHFANILNVKIFNNVSISDSCNKINSLCPKGYFTFCKDEWEECEEETFKYEEKLPNKLDTNTNMYVLESFIYTNMDAEQCNEIEVFKIESKNIVFY
ncbi:MAG: type I-B CRISPR-associated protein Cas5b [Clostridium sp.]|uniref:type I-B CRISPR-associated protein Cas5b n=1 Tax=Clostridium sp. TaxID=1506 RepID=UPI002FC7D39E